MMLQMFSNPRVKLETITSEDMPDEVNKCGPLTIYLLNCHDMEYNYLLKVLRTKNFKIVNLNIKR